MMIMMMVVMVAGRFRYGLRIRAARFPPLPASSADGTPQLAQKLFPLRFGLPQAVHVCRPAFSDSECHFHRFFHALLQGKLLHGPEHASLGLGEQSLGHPCLR